MLKKNFLRRLTFWVIIGQLIFFWAGSFVFAKADDLVIDNDGKIVLILTSNNSVLGVKIQVVGPENKPLPSEKPSASSSPAPTQTIPLVPAHVESIVRVTPPLNNDKKIQVTISTVTPTSTPAPSASPVSTTATAQTPAKPVIPNPQMQKAVLPTTPSNVITKTVDQVVQQGSNGQPIVSIKSDQANKITIQQGSIESSTKLPVQIDNTTHAMSVVTLTGPAKMSVLPSEAVKGVSKQGLITNSPAIQTTITQENGQAIYNIQGEKRGKLLGLFEVKTPVEVKMSAKTGKIINTSQSLFFDVLGFLVK